MWFANKTPKREPQPDDDDHSPSAKRRRYASSPSEDSDENGQNALGISFGDFTPTNAKAKVREVEIADSQEIVEDCDPSKDIDPFLDNERVAEEASAQNNHDKDTAAIADQASVSPQSTDNAAAAAIVQITTNLQNRLVNKVFKFTLNETKTIVRWMRMHRTFKISHHKAEFDELADHLGLTNEALSQIHQNDLRGKLRSKLHSLHAGMKKHGAIVNEYEGYESAGSSAFRPLQFAEWTLMWSKNGWDGSLQKPDRATYEAIMNERDENSESSEGGATDDHVHSEKDSEQHGGRAPQLAEKQPEVHKTHYDKGYDGIEIFAIEEPSEQRHNEDRPPPKDKSPEEASGWNHYLLNKEIIDAQDWNYRVITAQHLGIDLKDLAVLYPDPFPGYEHPPREGFAPAPATPTRSVASPEPVTPDTPSPPPKNKQRTLDRPGSDESISLLDTESGNETTPPKATLIPYADDEDLGDDEMEEEDTVEAVDVDGLPSQSQPPNAGQGAPDAGLTTPTPMTPQRSISRSARTPRSITPSMYTAIWSPNH